MSRWILSVDLGQSIDPTAICALEVSTRDDAVQAQFTDPPGELATLVNLDWFPRAGGGIIDPTRVVRVNVRHLERLPLRTPYPEQVYHVARLLRRAPLGGPGTSLTVDQTGVGRPVVDVMRHAGLDPVAVTITAGDGESRTPEGDYRVSKLLLVSNMQAMLNEGVLRIAKGLPDARALALELQDFRATYSDTGYARFGAREGRHDDLVLSVAIGAYWATRQQAREARTFPFAV